MKIVKVRDQKGEKKEKSSSDTKNIYIDSLL